MTAISNISAHSSTDANAIESAAVELGANELPATCPNPKMALWSSHPKVYLDVATTGHAQCPYCGTEYKLKPGTVLNHHH